MALHYTFAVYVKTCSRGGASYLKSIKMCKSKANTHGDTAAGVIKYALKGKI